MMLNPQILRNFARTALAEDVGQGDLTTETLLEEHTEAQAVLVTRSRSVCAGLPLVAYVFEELDERLHFAYLANEGQDCPAGFELARISGNARSILTAERTALNFLQRLCGVATLTRQYVEAVRFYGTTILDTRKTTPGQRGLEKYAVRQGGGVNHRLGLYDGIMIKDNHKHVASLDSASKIAAAVEECKAAYPEVEVEVEADTLEEARAASQGGADYVLLDNMSLSDLQAAVETLRGATKLEASGGITLESVSDVAATGVDFISVGALTHSAPAADIGLDFY